MVSRPQKFGIETSSAAKYSSLTKIFAATYSNCLGGGSTVHPAAISKILHPFKIFETLGTFEKKNLIGYSQLYTPDENKQVRDMHIAYY